MAEDNKKPIQPISNGVANKARDIVNTGFGMIGDIIGGGISAAERAGSFVEENGGELAEAGKQGAEYVKDVATSIWDKAAALIPSKKEEKPAEPVQEKPDPEVVNNVEQEQNRQAHEEGF